MPIITDVFKKDVLGKSERMIWANMHLIERMFCDVVEKKKIDPAYKLTMQEEACVLILSGVEVTALDKGAEIQMVWKPHYIIWNREKQEFRVESVG
jgi:hypothetical protein